MFNKNRRKFVRLPAHHLIKYRLVQGANVVSFARNLSAGGILFYSKEPVEKGSTVEITMRFPGVEEDIRFLAKVLRVKGLKKIGGFEIGAQFLDISEKDMKMINSRINDTMNKVKGKRVNPTKEKSKNQAMQE